MVLDTIIIGSDSFIASQFYDSIENKENIKLYSRQSSRKDHEIIKEDLFDISYLDFVGFDVVINFAAIVHQPKLNDNALYRKVNTDLSVYLAQEAKKAGVKHFIQMSTIAVYGNHSLIDIKTPEKPVNIYGESKLAADRAILNMQEEKFCVSIIRPPMVYGGGKSPGNMERLIHLSLKKMYLPFKGVSNNRDFINVKNLADCIKIIINNNLSGVLLPTDRNSISTEYIITIACEFANVKCRLFKPPILFLKLLKKLNPSIYAKLYNSLKVDCNISEEYYTPKYSVEEGISQNVKALYL